MTADTQGGPHLIAWTIDDDGVQAALSCIAPHRAWCRMGCPKDCPTWGPEHEHGLVDSGECQVIPWFENTDETIIELYQGDPHPLRDGEVELVWTGEDEFWWRYP